MPFLHFQSRKDKSSYEVKNEWRSQNRAAVKGDLEGDKETAGRAQVAQFHIDPLGLVGKLGVVFDMPTEHMIGADEYRFEADGDEAVGAQIQGCLLFGGQRKDSQPVGEQEQGGNLLRAWG